MSSPSPYWFARVSPPGRSPNRIVPICGEGVAFFLAALVIGVFCLAAGALLVVFGLLELGLAAVLAGAALLTGGAAAFVIFVRTLMHRTDPEKTYMDYREERLRARNH